jgi:trehalose synthase
MSQLLDAYQEVVGKDAIDELSEVAASFEGKKIVHVNSTKAGGGVAEILHRMLPLMNELGIKTGWEVMEGENTYYDVTKSFHNGLQGNEIEISNKKMRIYEQTNKENANRLRPILEEADVVFIHDPQPAPLLKLCPDRRGAWIWRCHIDIGRPWPTVWERLRPFLTGYQASIFHMQEFVKTLPHKQAIIPPSIDPLSDKNKDLPDEEVKAVFEKFGLDPQRPMIIQVSRFDWFKDPLGVIDAYRLAKDKVDMQLVLAGGGADDDPEGAEVLAKVKAAGEEDKDIHVLLLPSDAHLTINALQRAANVVVQKSTKEGFGLTVTEGMWKGRPVIGGDAGGIRLQIKDGDTGYLVRSPEEAAERVVHLLQNEADANEIGRRGKEFVRQNFMITRHTKDYLQLAKEVS